MTLFRLIAALVIAALAAGILYDVRLGNQTWSGVWRFFREQTGTAIRFWRERKRLAPGSMQDHLRRLTYGLSAGFLALLALTGFLPVLLLGERLSGALLIIHVTVAPLFAVCLSALALLWAYRFRFEEEDWHFVLIPSYRKGVTGPRRVRLVLKIGFWLVLVLSLPLMGSIILGMYPLFGTDGQQTLIRLHGYSALLLLVASVAVIHLTIVYLQNTSEQPSKESTQ